MGQLAGAESSMFPNGNIAICTFVKLDSTEGYVVAAGNGDAVFGIAGPETHTMSVNIQGTNLDDGFAGVAGGPAIKIYGVGATRVPLRVAAATNIGDRLISDTNGYGAVTTSDKVKVAAIAMQTTATANTIISVDVVRFDSSV